MFWMLSCAVLRAGRNFNWQRHGSSSSWVCLIVFLLWLFYLGGPFPNGTFVTLLHFQPLFFPPFVDFPEGLRRVARPRLNTSELNTQLFQFSLSILVGEKCRGAAIALACKLRERTVVVCVLLKWCLCHLNHLNQLSGRSGRVSALRLVGCGSALQPGHT